MPTSPAGNKAPPRGQRGFTLIELMIVVTIIGLASAAAVMAIPDPRGRLIDEASRFAVRTRVVHDLAVVDARPVSMWVSAGGYGFDQRQAGAWVPIVDKPLRVTSWSKGTQAIPATTMARDRVMFDSTGLADRPLDVTLTRADERVTVHVGTDGGVKVGD